jgi:hypothetical protein
MCQRQLVRGEVPRRTPFPRPQTGGSDAPHVWAAHISSQGPIAKLRAEYVISAIRCLVCRRWTLEPSVQHPRCRIDADALPRHARHNKRDAPPVLRRTTGVGLDTARTRPYRSSTRTLTASGGQSLSATSTKAFAALPVSACTSRTALSEPSINWTRYCT